MLYALLNGGAAYVDKDGAYPDCDGAFDAVREKQLDEDIARYSVVAGLQEQVAAHEMVKHEFLDGNLYRQRTLFAGDGGFKKWGVLDWTFIIAFSKGYF